MRAFSAAVLLATLAPLPQYAVQAQDAVPETPPELRDFRLDQPQSQPQSQPQPTAQPTPQAEPPPVVRTLPDTATEQSAPANRTVPAPRRAEVPQQSAPSASAGNEDAPPEPVAEDTARPDASADPVVPVASDAVAAPTPAPSDSNIGLLSVIATAIAAIAFLAFLWLRRRRHQAADVAETTETHAIDALTPTGDKAEEKLSEQAAHAEPKPAPELKQPAPAVPGDVTIAFYPEKATVSFTTLTVQGQFQISNAGETAIRDMQLRAVLLSASSQQQSAVEIFFAKPGQIPKNPLGDAKPGERLGLSLELSVPLNEMQTFPLGEQQLLVPIIVASLSYSDDQGNHAGEARLANMIGREAQPPQPKMGPLRLDKGPRSFAPLGQRPIYT